MVTTITALTTAIAGLIGALSPIVIVLIERHRPRPNEGPTAVAVTPEARSHRWRWISAAGTLVLVLSVAWLAYAGSRPTSKATATPSTTPRPSASSIATPTPTVTRPTSPPLAACFDLTTTAQREVDALQVLHDAVDADRAAGRIRGTDPSYEADYEATVTAVRSAKDALTEYRRAGDVLPKDGSFFVTDLGTLLNTDLPRLKTLIQAPATDDDSIYLAWNQLTVYGNNANIVAGIQCPSE